MAPVFVLADIAESLNVVSPAIELCSGSCSCRCFSRAMLLVIMGLILFLIKVRLSTRNIGHGITKILAKETNSAN